MEKYEIIHATRLKDLEDKVNEKIDAGWSVVGGVSATLVSGDGQDRYCQAMIKKGIT